MLPRCGAVKRPLSSDAPAGEAAPSTSLLPETTTFLPPMATRVMVFDSPGSKRTDAPAGTLIRLPKEAERSNIRLGLVSMKW